MVNWKIDKLTDKIFEDQSLTQKVKLKYLSVIRLNSNFDQEQAKTFEDRLFDTANEKLSDKERVSKELKELQDEELPIEITNQEDMFNVKKAITRAQLDRGILPKFYSVVDSVLEDKCTEYGIKEEKYRFIKK